jgi:hypothetical protein
MREDVSALDDQIRETVNRALDSLRGRLESELGSCQDELARVAQEASARIGAEAAEHATAEARREAEQQIAEIREAAARDSDELGARLTDEIEDLRRRLNDTEDESRRRLEESERRIEESERRIEESRLQLEVSGRDTDTARQEAESARQRVETLREEAQTATQELESAQKQLDETREDVVATLRDIEAARRDSDAARAEVLHLSEALRRKEERALQATRLPEAVRDLDESGAFGDVLESLAHCAGREAGRAAVFLVKRDRLLDWRTVGFGFAPAAPRLDIGLSDSEPMAEAVRTGRGVRYGIDHVLPDFARNNEVREAAAWPVSVGGSVVAVLYADGPVADKSDEPYWPAFLDVLTRYAGRVLEGITVRQAAGLMTGRSGFSPSSSVRHQSSRSI